MGRVMLTILALAFFASPVQAQNEEWRHPRNLYSLQPQATGWQVLTGQPSHTLAAFGPISDQQVVRLCSIRERRIQVASSMSQAELNELNTRLQPQDARVSDAHALDIDGVAVNAYRFEEPGRAVLFYRSFVVLDGSEVSHQEVNCGGPLPITQADEASFQAFLHSLHFPTDH